jgi:hypothetical protein
MELIQKPGIQLYNKIRLGILYALRYQKNSNQIGAVVEALIKAGASESDAGVSVVFHDQGWFSPAMFVACIRHA